MLNVNNKDTREKDVNDFICIPICTSLFQLGHVISKLTSFFFPGNLPNLRNYFDEGYKKIKSDAPIKSGSDINENRNVLHRRGSNMQPYPTE